MAKTKKESWIWNALGVIVVLLIIFGVIAMFQLRTEGTQCLVDPIKYGADNLAKSLNQEVIIGISTLGKETVFYSTNVTRG